MMRARTLLLGTIASVCAVSAVTTLAWAGLTPIGGNAEPAAREEIFEIPKGTWARRMSGEAIAILPDEIRLTLGLRDILVLKNRDDAPQLFGPTLMMPGQSFRMPFDQAAEYQFACTAHASGQMTIIVEPYPATPWARIRWRAHEAMRGVNDAPRTTYSAQQAPVITS